MMAKILVRKIELSGDFKHSASEDSNFPAYWDVEKTYKEIDRFLRANAQPIIPLKAQVPFIQDGFIGSFMAFSCYDLNRCLIANGFRPYFKSVVHSITIASKLENKSKLESTLNLLKGEAGRRWVEYWVADNEKILESSERLSEPSSFLLPFQKLLAKEFF